MQNSPETPTQFVARKREHLEIALQDDVVAREVASLERVTLIHDSLPELNLSEVSIESSFRDQTLATPFYIAGMTGGHTDAEKINFTLAEAAAQRGWLFGIGSQRREIESDFLDASTALTTQFPKLKLIANLGVSQLITLDQKNAFLKLQAILDRLNPALIAIHLNPLQEAIQKEGTPNFKGAIQALKKLISTASAPVVIKETGSGMSSTTLLKIKELKPFAIDVSGLGGTHWGRIEGKRAENGSISAELGKTFSLWGTSTLESVQKAVEILLPTTEVWASGGICTGLDAAKCLALGARRVGFARPALEAALAGSESLQKWMAAREQELRVALFCTGSATLDDLNKTKISLGGRS